MHTEFATAVPLGPISLELGKAIGCLCLDEIQLELWFAFTETAQRIAARHRYSQWHLRALMPDRAPSFVDQISLRHAAMLANLDALAELREASAELYSALTVPQQRLADRLLARAFWEIMQSGRVFQIDAECLMGRTLQKRPAIPPYSPKSPGSQACSRAPEPREPHDDWITPRRSRQ